MRFGSLGVLLRLWRRLFRPSRERSFRALALFGRQLGGSSLSALGSTHSAKRDRLRIFLGQLPVGLALLS